MNQHTSIKANAPTMQHHNAHGRSPGAAKDQGDGGDLFARLLAEMGDLSTATTNALPTDASAALPDAPAVAADSSFASLFSSLPGTMPKPTAPEPETQPADATALPATIPPDAAMLVAGMMAQQPVPTPAAAVASDPVAAKTEAVPTPKAVPIQGTPVGETPQVLATAPLAEMSKLPESIPEKSPKIGRAHV